MKIVFMGTPVFSVNVLKAIAKEHEVVLVVSQPDKKKGRGLETIATPISQAAKELGLNLRCPDKIVDIYEELKSLDFDFIVTAAYGQFLPEKILKLPKIKAINVHASLLPKYRGGAPIQYAILNGDDKTGISIMEMIKQMDAGNVYVQDEITILKQDNLEIVHDKLSLLASNMINDAINHIANGLNSNVQNEDEVTYAYNISKEECLINWEDTSINIYNHVRAFNPFPVTKTTYHNEVIKIYEVLDIDLLNSEKCGTIVDITNNAIIVSAQDKCIAIKSLQIPNKKRISVEEFLKGNKNYFKVGEIFE